MTLSSRFPSFLLPFAGEGKDEGNSIGHPHLFPLPSRERMKLREKKPQNTEVSKNNLRLHCSTLPLLRRHRFLDFLQQRNIDEIFGLELLCLRLFFRQEVERGLDSF